MLMKRRSMACYAALLSVSHILNNIRTHPRPPISLDQNQVESLTQNLTFFQHFLESYPNYEDDELERRIAAAAYAAEDVIEIHIVDQIQAQSNITTIDLSRGPDLVIETHIVNQIHATSTSHDHGENIGCVDFCKARWRVMNSIKKKVKKIMGAQSVDLYGDLEGVMMGAQIVDQAHSVDLYGGLEGVMMGAQIVDQAHSVDLYGGLEGVIGEMYLIKKDVMQIIQDKIITPHLHTNSSSGGPAAAASTWQSSITPVFDDAMINRVLDKLTGQQSDLQIIPIVGMGGMGKTTFATSIYSHSLVVEHFDIQAWVTISQEYSIRNMLDVLCQEVKARTSALSEDDIGLKLYQHLYGRRYLIVMDDIWSVEAWDNVRCYFPENNNGSRIMITTRLSNLAFHLSDCHVFQMPFLDEDKSWDLLCEIVFGKQDCPIELENVGKEIARKCKGLPLSIDVIGGLLRKSNMTQAYWMYTAENLNLLISLESDEYTLRILRTSYKELPIHLKPCFLYMGIFPEDIEIEISALVNLWVAEGILRPIDDKSLEEVAKEYLKELIDRNLILISRWNSRWDGKARFCKIHDLLRDVCLSEAQKQKFFRILRQQKHRTPRGINMERRICINVENAGDKFSPKFLHVVETASLTRSLLYKPNWIRGDFTPSLHFRLLRVYSSVCEVYGNITRSNNAIFEQTNMRYLSLWLGSEDATIAPRLLLFCSRLWNLQTLYVHSVLSKIVLKLWEMPLLRHVTLRNFVLPDPPYGEDNFVLENLQKLKCIKNFKFSEEWVKRIPNIKKLSLRYESDRIYDEELSDFCLHNLGRLQKLESLSVEFFIRDRRDLAKVARNLVSFPHSLKKLTLMGTKLNWKELTIRISSLPLLQHLILSTDACVGPRWETIEGQFCSLKILKIYNCRDLKDWDTDGAHFPSLEHLLLEFVEMDEIPSSIGDIPTLKLIKVVRCSKSVDDSARRIKDEQEENENEDLQVVIEPLFRRWI